MWISTLVNALLHVDQMKLIPALLCACVAVLSLLVVRATANTYYTTFCVDSVDIECLVVRSLYRVSFSVVENALLLVCTVVLSAVTLVIITLRG